MAKDFKKANEYLKRSQKFDDSAEGYFSIGSCYFLAGDYDQAVIFLRCALKKDPGHYSSALLLAECHKKKGSYLDAIGAYKVARTIKPDQVSLLYQMGSTAFEHGDYYQAKEFLKQYVVLEMNTQARQEGENLLKKAKVLAMKNIPPEVEKQTDFLKDVRVLGILKFGKKFQAFLEFNGARHEVDEGDTILNKYYVLSIREERIVLTCDETYIVVRPR
jgi:tetratricopeptide (TPR) repeat protein